MKKKKNSSADMLKKLSAYSEISARLISKRAASVFAKHLIFFFVDADYKSVIVVVCGRNAGEALKVRVYYIKQAKVWAYNLLPHARHDMFRLRCIIKQYCSTGKEAA